MLKTLWFMIKIGVLVALTIWVSGQPGHINLNWQDYQIRIHLGLFLLGIFGFLFVCMMVYRFFFALSRLPKKFREAREKRRQKKGQQSIVRGLSALAAGDVDFASLQARRAQKYLAENHSLSLLLQAQAARLNGNEALAIERFQSLSQDKDAAFLGVRGLLQSYIESGDHEKAMEMGHKALKLHPRQPWIVRAVYDLEAGRRKWDEALILLDRMERLKGTNKEKIRSDRVAILTIQSDEAVAEEQRQKAVQKLEKAVRLDPNFVPAITRLVHLYLPRNERRKGVRLVEKAWKEVPHPDLAEAWASLAPSQKSSTPPERLKWHEKLVTMQPNSAEAHLALGRAALGEKLWGDARHYLEKAERLEPSPRVYKMLAALEDQSAGDPKDVQKWLAKAADSKPQKGWVCSQTGMVYKDWDIIAQPHGGFNTIQWAEIDSPDLAPLLPRIGHDALFLNPEPQKLIA